jgi:hypothetical protein
VIKCGFRPALGPGHGHLLNAVSEISRQAVSDIGGKAVSDLRLDLDMGIYEVRSPRALGSAVSEEARKCGLREERECGL